MRVGGALDPPAAASPLLQRRTIPTAGVRPVRNRGRQKGADLHASPARGDRPSRHNQQDGASLDQEAAGVPRTEERPSQAGIPAPICSADCSSARPAARPSPRAEPQRTDSCAKLSPVSHRPTSRFCTISRSRERFLYNPEFWDDKHGITGRDIVKLEAPSIRPKGMVDVLEGTVAGVAGQSVSYFRRGGRGRIARGPAFSHRAAPGPAGQGAFAHHPAPARPSPFGIR